MPVERRLEGWKQVATYLGRSVKTAQRWKAERGLPIYQDQVTGRVHGFAEEINEWLKRQHGLDDEPREVADDPPPEPKPRKRRDYWVLALVLLTMTVGGAWLLLARRSAPVLVPNEPITAGRVLWRATAEGRSRTNVATPSPAAHLVITTDDSRLIGADNLATKVWVMDPRSGAVQWIDPGTAILSLAVTPNGKTLYIGSAQDGLIAVKLPSLEIGPRIRTGGAINDMAITPDSSQVFLAMMHRGVKRFDVSTGLVKDFRRQPCPYFVELSASGKLLAVSDQCGGVEGREGHDTVEVLDSETGKSLHFFKGPPMVGGDLKFSPDGELLFLDAWDACRTPKYDHEGCPAVPAWIWQVFRLPVDRLVKTVELPADSGRPPVFVSQRAAVTSGLSIAVWDTVRFSIREEAKASWVGSTLRSWDGRRLFMEASRPETGPRVSIFEREPEECALPESSLVSFLPFDGAAGDWVENSLVGPAEKVHFVPGVVGQAIRLNGDERLLLGTSSSTPFAVVDSTMMMYVRPQGRGPMPLLDAPPRPSVAGWAVGLDEALTPVWQLDPVGSPARRLTATGRLEEGRWSHLAFVRDRDKFLCYINGEPAGSITVPGANMLLNPRPMPFGHSERLAKQFVGAVDELAIWSRALSPEEVKTQFGKRTTGPCKP